jgi:hypothetical protein
MRNIGETIKHEIREILPAVLYFFILFNALGFTKALMLRDYGITVSTFANATLGALVVAKVVLLVGVLPFMEPFPRIPIIYNVLWKTLLYSLGAFIFQVLEEAIPLLLTHRSLAPALDMVGMPHFWATQIWLVLLLLVFCTFRELIHVLGAEQANEIFLGIRSSDVATKLRGE